MNKGINLVWNTGAKNLIQGAFLDSAREQGLHHSAVGAWPTGATLADVDLPCSTSYRNQHGEHAVFELGEGSRAYVSIEHELAFVHVAAGDTKAAADGLARIRELVPLGDSSTEEQIPVTFWAYNPRGPLQVRRNLDAPTWEEIAGNYTAATRTQLDALAEGFRPGRGGQLILWAGKPGTGKTTAIRALARAWREWAEVHYVTDPDKFFGSEADYMLSVLLEDGNTIAAPGEKLVERWRVLLLEDAGELLQADARERTGQGLSRFLNAVDGLIGQGLRVLVLVTTNEDVRKLNPAVARPGRCAANIEFGELDSAEARAWLIAHGGQDLPCSPATLAELFAEVEGFQGEPVSRPFGFTREAAA